jgi:hypothetical protein
MDEYLVKSWSYSHLKWSITILPFLISTNCHLISHLGSKIDLNQYSFYWLKFKDVTSILKSIHLFMKASRAGG